jgi:hypothetical protein
VDDSQQTRYLGWSGTQDDTMVKNPKIHLNYFTLDFITNPYSLYLTNLKKIKNKKTWHCRGWGGGGGVGEGLHFWEFRSRSQLGLVHSPQIKTFLGKPLLKRKKNNYLFILVGWGARRLSMGHNFCALAAAASLLPWSFTRLLCTPGSCFVCFLSLALSLSRDN